MLLTVQFKMQLCDHSKHSHIIMQLNKHYYADIAEYRATDILIEASVLFTASAIPDVTLDITVRLCFLSAWELLS